jgi:hypothetical protein
LVEYKSLEKRRKSAINCVKVHQVGSSVLKGAQVMSSLIKRRGVLLMDLLDSGNILLLEGKQGESSWNLGGWSCKYFTPDNRELTIK